MYYEIMSKPTSKHVTRNYILTHKEQIMNIVTEMLKNDAPIRFDNYDIYKEPFITFAQDIIEKYIILNEPKVEYVIQGCELIDKHIILKPKLKSVVEIMKKYNDNV